MPLTHLSKGSPKPAPPKDKVRLYDMRFCPFSERTRLVLAAKGIDYECVYINIKNKPDWFLAEPNPSGLVPMLELPGGKALTESLICCDFLEDSAPQNKLYPKDPFSRCRERLLVERFAKCISNYFRLLNGVGDEEENAQLLTKNFSVYENELEDRSTTFFGGDSPGMLDYMIWPFFERLPTSVHKLPMDINHLPILTEWMSAMYEDPAVKQVAFPNELHLKFAKNYGKEDAQLYE